MNLAEREPLAIRAAITAAVTALVHVAAVYGLVAKDQEVAIGTAIDVVGALVLVIWARAGVTGNAKVITQVTNEGTVVAGDAAVTPTGTELDVATPAGSMFPKVQPVPVKPALIERAA